MKKFLLGLIIGILTTASAAVFAGVALYDVHIADETKLVVFGSEVDTDIVYAVKADDPNGYGKNYVSARDLAEALGYNVEWDEENNAIVVDFAGSTDYNDDYGTDELITMEEIAEMTRDQIGSMENIFGDMLSLDIQARGNSLVYSYKYLIDIPYTDAMGTYFEQFMGEYSSVFDSLLQMIRGMGIESPSVIVEYLDKDGNLIYSKEFK